MQNQKTGLVLESLESAKTEGTPHSAETSVVKEKACTVTTVKIKTDSDAKKFQREKGTYITVEMDEICKITDSDFESIIITLAKTVRSLINICDKQRVLIVGIGNREVTPDSLGPKCVDRIIVTRGFEKIMPELITKDGFASVCAVSSNVFGVTGIESAELISGISATIDPALVIVIDALATGRVERLCKTVQISNTSLTPGGGVGNTRDSITCSSLGCPMLSIGMPTVLDLEGLAVKGELCDKNTAEGLIVTPMNIDTATDTAAKLIAFSLNKALHYDMSTEDILKFLY